MDEDEAMFWLPDYYWVYVKQIGGKYGTFTCPECGSPHCDYKFTANAGWCNNCDLYVQAVGGRQVEPGRPEDVDHYKDFQRL